MLCIHSSNSDATGVMHGLKWAHQRHKMRRKIDMSDLLTTEDERYAALFDVANEARKIGNVVDVDLNLRMNELRNQATVQKGSLIELLGMPPRPHMFTTERQGYTLFSFEACEMAFRDVKTFSSHVWRESPGIMSLGPVILRMDSPEHKAHRATIQPMFIQPRTATWWRQNWIQEIVDTLLDQFKIGGRAELNLQFCARVPMHTVARGIGIPSGNALDFRDHLLRSLDAVHGEKQNHSPEGQRASMQWISDTLTALVTRRREEPGDDVVTGLIKATLAMPGEEPRPLTDQEITAACKLVILAGGGTTWRQLGILIWGLLTDYKQWEACRDDRSLIESAVDESLRWNATDPIFPRLTTRDIEVDGVLIPEGSRVDICLGAANRDPTRWDNPDQFDIFRPKQAHLGFAIGEHQCLGMNVAKQEMIVSLNGLMDRFPNMHLDPDLPAPQLIGGLEQRGMSSIPVVFA